MINILSPKVISLNAYQTCQCIALFQILHYNESTTAQNCLCYYLHWFPDFFGYERWLLYQLYYDKQECNTILNLYQSSTCQTSQYHYARYYDEVYSIKAFYIIIFINILTSLELKGDSSINLIMIKQECKHNSQIYQILHIYVKQVNNTIPGAIIIMSLHHMYVYTIIFINVLTFLDLEDDSSIDFNMINRSAT